jgi:hypothetical protein
MTALPNKRGTTMKQTNHITKILLNTERVLRMYPCDILKSEIRKYQFGLLGIAYIS